MTTGAIAVREARRALDAAIREAQADGVPMSFAVADRHGDLVIAVRMDGSPARVLQHAIRQAFTSSTMQRDTVVFKEQLRERDGSLEEWGNPMLTTLPGGVAIVRDGEIIGAIGAGGGATLPRDTEIARIAAAAATAR